MQPASCRGRLQAEVYGPGPHIAGCVFGKTGRGLNGIQATDTAAGADCRGAIAHHEAKQHGQQQPAYDDQAAAGDYQDQAAAGDQQDQVQYAPPPADPADEIEHLAQLHASGVLTDDEFTAAKAKILGT